MKQAIKYINLFFILCILTLTIHANNLTEYEYHTKINVNCSEYIGYLELEMPNEYDLINNPKTYLANNNFKIIKQQEIQTHIKHQNWYSKKIDNLDVVEIEKITDNNYNTYLLLNNKSSIEFNLENPNIQKIDRIEIKVKDTVINNIEIANGEVDTIQHQDSFNYIVQLKERINSNNIKLKIDFNDLLKIEEITLFETQTISENSKLYFNINNNCEQTFNLYYGTYGKDHSTYTTIKPNIQKEFNINIENNKNSLYSTDFDKDGIKNKIDNCIYLKNKEQKDINYNNIGDACEDFDNDGILNQKDNCPEKSNRNQLDDDNDGIGNLCDEGDNRFFESNKIIVYAIIIIVCMLFVILSFNLFKKK